VYLSLSLRIYGIQHPYPRPTATIQVKSSQINATSPRVSSQVTTSLRLAKSRHHFKSHACSHSQITKSNPTDHKQNTKKSIIYYNIFASLLSAAFHSSSLLSTSCLTSLSFIHALLSSPLSCTRFVPPPSKTQEYRSSVFPVPGIQCLSLIPSPSSLAHTIFTPFHALPSYVPHIHPSTHAKQKENAFQKRWSKKRV
jgi:hypothetical protein